MRLFFLLWLIASAMTASSQEIIRLCGDQGAAEIIYLPQVQPQIYPAYFDPAFEAHSVIWFQSDLVIAKAITRLIESSYFETPILVIPIHAKTGAQKLTKFEISPIGLTSIR
jgi:hypothetical protein